MTVSSGPTTRHATGQSLARYPVVVLVVVVLLFGTVQVGISMHRLATLQADTMDLGYVEQVLWKISHGDWWAFSTVFQTPGLAADGCVWLYPIAYAFRYLGGPAVLFVLQALGTALASWGLYRAGRLHRLPPWSSTVMAGTFLLYPAILGGSQFDFHPDFLALPAVIWAYVADAEGRPRLYYALLLVAALSKNVILVSFVGWGVGLIVWRHRVRDGLIVIAGSVALLGAEFLWIIPTYLAHGTEAINFGLYRYLGSSIPGVVIGLVTRFPALLSHLATEPAYAVWILGPVLGLALAGAASLPAFLALFAMNAASMFTPQQRVNDQYQVLLAGWVFLAVIEALARRPRLHRLWVGAIAAATVAFEAVLVGTYIAPLFVPPPATTATAQMVARQIAPTSIVWTQNRLGPLTYRAAVMGVARDATPGVMLDGLPTLWREGAARGLQQTTLFGERPASPYFAAVIGQALAAGYHVSDHRGGFFLITGTRHFRVQPPAAVANGWQPRAASWTIPAWTQARPVGYVDWQARMPVVVARAQHPGTVVGPVAVVLEPGTYRLTLWVQTRAPAKTPRPLGWLSVGAARAAIRAGTRLVVLHVTLTRSTVASIVVSSTGAARFGVLSLNVAREAPPGARGA